MQFIYCTVSLHGYGHTVHQARQALKYVVPRISCQALGTVPSIVLGTQYSKKTLLINMAGEGRPWWWAGGGVGQGLSAQHLVPRT